VKTVCSWLNTEALGLSEYLQGILSHSCCLKHFNSAYNYVAKLCDITRYAWVKGVGVCEYLIVNAALGIWLEVHDASL